MPNNEVKPKSFLSQCKIIVSKYVVCNDPLMFEVVDEANGVYALRNAKIAIHMDRLPRFYILQVKNSRGLYLHVSVTLKAPNLGASLERIHEFEGISIQFIQGTGKLFCRAEWDVKKKKEKLEHPQPHWHWGYEKEIKETEASELILSADETKGSFLNEIVETGPSLPLIDFDKMHYAMASKWAVQDASVEKFTVQGLYNWLEYCITNVIDQYNYQVSKRRFVSSKAW